MYRPKPKADMATRKNARVMPCVDANEEGPARTLTAAAAPVFAYEGRGLTLAEFQAYVASYAFGTIAPDQIVLHNTANPDATWAPLNSDPAIKWDGGEAGMTALQVYNKRNTQLDRIRNYYRDTLGWNAGPHLFVDDRYIWLFTPMDTVGIHAKEGNSYRDSAGRLHYSIGVEVVGWYGKVGWPAPVQALLRGAIRALSTRLGIAIQYKAAPLHRPDMHQGSIAFHNDYNKPECPGASITPAYAMLILQQPPPPPPIDPWPLRWGPIAPPDQTSWDWAIPAKWKAHWQMLGPCISSALYDKEHGLVVQCFEGGVVRQQGNGIPEVCFRA